MNARPPRMSLAAFVMQLSPVALLLSPPLLMARLMLSLIAVVAFIFPSAVLIRPRTNFTPLMTVKCLVRACLSTR